MIPFTTPPSKYNTPPKMAFSNVTRKGGGAFVSPDAFKNLFTPPGSSTEKILAELEQAGYRRSGSDAVKITGHVGAGYPTSSKLIIPGSEIGKMAAAGGPRLTDQLAEAVFTDISNLQQANNDQFTRGQGIADAFKGLLQPSADSLEQLAREQNDRLGGLASSIMDQGNEAYGDVKEQVDAANVAAAHSVEEAQRAEKEYRDNSVASAALMAKGIWKNSQKLMRQIDEGVNPDGTVMNESQKRMARHELQQETRNTTAQAVVPYVQQAEQFAASLTHAVSQAYKGQADTHLGGAGVLAQAGQIRTNNAQLSASLVQYGESLLSAAKLAGVNLLLDGHQALFAMNQSNPYGVVSLAEGISTILAAKTIPYQEQIPAYYPQG